MKRHTYSMTQVVILMTALVIAISMTGIALLSAYQRNDMLRQAAEGSHDTLRMHVRDVDDQFIRLENFMYDVFFDNRDANTIIYSNDEVTVYQAKQSLLNLLDQMIRLINTTECTWVYIPQKTSHVFLSRCSHTGIISTDYERVNQWIVNVLSDQSMDATLPYARWLTYEDAGEVYMIWLMQSRGVYCGTWVTLSRLQQLTEYALREVDNTVDEVNFMELSSEEFAQWGRR